MEKSEIVNILMNEISFFRICFSNDWNEMNCKLFLHEFKIFCLGVFDIKKIAELDVFEFRIKITKSKLRCWTPFSIQKNVALLYTFHMHNVFHNVSNCWPMVAHILCL